MDKFEDFSAEVQKLFSCGDDVVVSPGQGRLPFGMARAKVEE
jgi:hypothetical protein